MKFFLLLLLLSSCSYFEHRKIPYYSGSKSDHFDGQRFVSDVKPPKVWDHLRFVFSIKEPWMYEHDEIEPVIFNEFKEVNRARITFIGHSTFLIQVQNINILTDPIWSDRAGPIPWPLFSVKRQNPPAMNLEDLPRIDFVFISHNSYYHMDIPTIKKLQEKFKPKFITGLGNCYYLQKIKELDITCLELDWDQKIKLQNDTDFYFVKTNGWSKRSWFDINKTLWGSLLIATPRIKIYFAGDWAYSQELRTIGEKYGPLDVAILPIGSYEPRWYMKPYHMNPNEAVKAHILLNTKKSIAAHFDTFQTTNEGYLDTRIALEESKLEYGLGKFDFVAPKFGEVFEF